MSLRVHLVCEATSNKACSSDSSVLCCDPFGKFLTATASCFTLRPGLKPQSVLGYCNRGGCASHVCNTVYNGMLLDVFCGASDINPCKASCSFDLYGACYDTASFPNGGENLQDGAICMKDRQKGELTSGAYTINALL